MLASLAQALRSINRAFKCACGLLRTEQRIWRSGGRLEQLMNSKLPFVHRFHAMTVPCEIQILSLDLTHFPKACGKNIADEIEQNTHRLEGNIILQSDDSCITRHINQRTTSEVELDSESAEVFGASRPIKPTDIRHI
ncbi:hypothetical protein OH492_14220 [Vibrio chagasii]|nr:hypothetical protein [Vibrio chagasii]